MSGRFRRLSGTGASAAGLLLALACAGAEAAPARWTSAEPAPAEHRSSASPRDRTVASAPLPTRKPRARPVAEFVPGEVVVRFRDGGGASTVSRVAERLKLRHRRSLPALGASVLGLGRGQTVAGGIAVLERQPEVLYAEPNYLYQLQATPNDPQFPSLWGMDQPSDADIDAPEAWDLHTGTSSTTVAVMDTGMAYDHPDLAPNVWSNPGETGGGKETNGVDDDGNGFVDDHRGWNFYALYEYQEVAIVGAPTGGTFTLTFDGETTAALSYNATAAAVESALIALPGIGPTDVAAFDGPLPGTPVVVGFQQANQPQMTATASLTGGASPAVVVTTLQDGASQDNDPRDYEGHGSHVAGTIGAKGNNGVHVPGVNWDVSLLNLRVCGEAGCPLDAIASAMAYAGEIVGGAPRARVANGSFGGPGFSQLMLEAINGAPETLFVFAAGNSTLDNDTDPDAFYPCSYPDGTTSATNTEDNILCVAAGTQTDGIAGFSNYGATTVDLGAPGVGTLSTVPDVDTVWSDDLETDGTWTTGGTNNTWARTTEVVSPPSGTHVLTDSPGWNYESSTNSFAQRTSTFDLTGRRSCAVEYSINLALGAGDLLHEEWTTDGTTWNSVPLGAWAGPGSTGGFVAVSEPLGVGDAANVNFRWRLETNVGTPANGVWLDDLQVACVATTYDGDETDVFSGTSMASPHVAGAAGLLFSYSTTLSPALASPLTPSQMKTIIIESVDPVAAFATKTVSGGRLNLHNMLAGGFCASDGVSLPATHIGTAGADVLTGTAGADVITGLAGNDQIDGGDDDDAICAGLGNDIVEGGAGSDDLFGGPGSDQLVGKAGDDKLDGQDGTDVYKVWTTAASVTASDTGVGDKDILKIYGSTLADLITIAPGSVVAGTATVTFSGVEGEVTVYGDGDQTGTGYGFGPGGNDVINAATYGGKTHLFGQAGNDTVTGGSGADGLNGGDGNDSLVGGAGNDTFDGGAGADSFDGGGGIDTLGYSERVSPVTVTLDGSSNDGSPGELDNAGVTIEKVLGGEGNDVLTGNASANVLAGGGGDDLLQGNDGNDTLDGGTGADVLQGGGGKDTVSYATRTSPVAVDSANGLPDDGASLGGEADNVGADVESIIGSSFDDVLRGSSAANTLYGLGGDDVLDGREGNDTLVGGTGSDDLVGGSGNDTVTYATATTPVFVNSANGLPDDGESFGGEGDNVGSDIEAIFGGPFDDFIVGSALANTIYGNAGDDELNGGLGKDTLHGGSGDDKLHALDGVQDRLFCGSHVGGDAVLDFDAIDVINPDCAP